jgi:hypothetical protein
LHNHGASQNPFSRSLPAFNFPHEFSLCLL